MNLKTLITDTCIIFGMIVFMLFLLDIAYIFKTGDIPRTCIDQGHSYYECFTNYEAIMASKQSL